MPTHAEPAHASKNKSPDSSVLQQRNRNHSTLQVEDNRPEAVMQRKLQAMVDASPQVLQLRAFQPMANSATSQQQCPIQRQSGKSGEIAAAMGQQYGVDTSPINFTHNSPFPATVGAAATIQGKDIHLGPGQDTTENIKHEVGHYIDNSINGTPTGDAVVNGYNVDTTRESAADRLAGAPLQRTAAFDGLGIKQEGRVSDYSQETTIQRVVDEVVHCGRQAKEPKKAKEPTYGDFTYPPPVTHYQREEDGYDGGRGVVELADSAAGIGITGDYGDINLALANDTNNHHSFEFLLQTLAMIAKIKRLPL